MESNRAIYNCKGFYIWMYYRKWKVSKFLERYCFKNQSSTNLHDNSSCLLCHFEFTWAECSSELFWSPVVCLSVNFSHFQLLLQNHWANFNQTSQSILGLRGFKFVQMFQGEIIEQCKILLKILKKSSPEPLGQIQPNIAQIILG